MPPLTLRLALASLLASPAPARDPYIAVVEKIAGAVGFFSEDGSQLAQVKVGSFPHEAVLSADGRYLYISDNGVLWMTEDRPGANSISVLDVNAMKKIGEISLGRFHRPHGLALFPDQQRLLATTERPFGLALVDVSAQKLIRSYEVHGKSPHMVILTPDAKIAFVSNTDSNQVAAIELQTGAWTLIPTGARPQGGALSAGGDRLYIACTDANRIAIIDTRSKRVIGEIPTGKGPARIALTPDGKTLIYNLQFEPAVGFADLRSGRQVAAVPLSGRPLSLALTRDGRRAFTGIQDQDKVAYLSTANRWIERIIATPKGSGPDAVIPLRP
jgi:YVTN family beta-propeller protein